MEKNATTSVPIHDFLCDRWSPRAFSDDPVAPAQITALLEAARWAASSMNAQPWSFVVADRTQDPESHAAMVSVLREGNQVWAQHAPVLILTLAQPTFVRNDRPNAHAWHDLGAATAQLVMQATSMGLHAHGMAGLLPDAARSTFSVPDALDIVAIWAVGHRAAPESLPEALETRERMERTRKPLAEIAHRGAFGTPWTSA